MIQANKSYIEGTAARKLEYDVYEENKVLKAKKQNRLNNKYKFKAVCMVLLMFAMMLAIIYRYAVITELNYNLDKSNQVYNELRNEYSRIKVEIEKSTDLTKIREIAESKFGMHTPDKYQYVYVKVPRNDYTKVADTQDEGKSDISGMLSALMGKITNS